MANTNDLYLWLRRCLTVKEFLYSFSVAIRISAVPPSHVLEVDERKGLPRVLLTSEL